MTGGGDNRGGSPARRLLGACAALLSIVALLGGCGGGETATATISTSSLSSAAFAARAETICAEGRLRALRYQARPSTGESEREAVTAAIETTVLPAIQDVIDKIHALGAPADEGEEVEAFLVPLQNAVSAAEELRVPTFEEVDRLLEPAGIKAKKYGLDSCVYG
ncbi:MAG TPA: hypothetical protein VEW07_01635 [Solirubrobacterales bacterium]|nr:hypothetical protein [Solirubrobacterales bacterium]